ncbi:M50 family metallopeptidase [Arenicella xantha]|uniref:Peptidase M50B-like protein n=1 Tax=Arenicella xantha TaxID=644221 RepID=A0A395JQF7_9GAMM|nr:M50 family metallopeptidase [Arenicella xantha]RBP53777.1 peptidase M50B-like protein [Arenicella xantha]
MTNRSSARRRAAALLLLAGLVFFVLSLFPIGRLIQWPFVILTTFIHELGHGLTAMLVGGKFIQMELYSDAAGLAQMRLPSGGWRSALVATGGLLAPALFGGALIVAGRSTTSSSRLFLILSIVILVSCVLWIRSIFGLTVMGLMGLGFLWLARQRRPGLHQFLIQFIGVHMLVDTVTRTLSYLFSPGASVNGVIRHSDTSAIAQAIGGSHLLWGTIIAILALSIFWFSLRRVYLR